MSNICNFLYSGPLENEFEECGLVILGHLLKGVVPEKRLVVIIIRVQHRMLPTVPIPSRVVHPDVIAEIGKQEGQGIGAV